MSDMPAPLRRGLTGYSVARLGVRLPSLAPSLLVVFTLAVWWPVLTYQWVATWDDAVFILGNPHVRQWSWVWMATTQWYGHWMPLTWLTFSANYALFGDAAWSWHAVNLALHTITAVLFFCVARRLVGSTAGALFAALVFAVHPLRMESVAWISERKDVVMGVCFVGAVLLWMQDRRVWAFVAFLAACASKSPAVLLPAMLVCLEWYRHEECCGPRISSVPFRALAPFFAVSLAVSAMAFWSLHTILVSIPWSVVGLGPRLLHVAYSEVFYAMQTVWPARLSGLIEYTWVPSWGQPQYPAAVAILALTTFVCLRTWRRWPGLTAALIGYAVAVFPQAGLFQNGPQLVANRYSYLACLPLALLAGAGLTLASRRFPRCAPVLAYGVVAALAVVTLVALPMWKHGDALWQYAADHEPTCTQCQDMAAAADLRHGDLATALRRQRQALRVSATTMAPRWERHWNLAAILLLTGQRDEARRELETYLALVPPARYESDRDHIDRARVALAQLEARR